MSRLRFVMPLFVIGLLSGSSLLGEDKKAEKELIIIRGQLPRYFKQLGLSNKQKKDVYLIQDKYAKEVKKLNEQIAALKEQGKVDMENVLTAGQKARLRELQSGKKEK